MLSSIKNTAIFSYTLASLLCAGSLVVETPSANATNVLLSGISCETLIALGDVVQDGCSFQLTTNALEEEDTFFEFPPGSGQSAPDRNLSGNPALDAPDLEAASGLESGALSFSLFEQAQQGSILQARINNVSDRKLDILVSWNFKSAEPFVASPGSIPGLPDDFGSFFNFYDAVLEIDGNNEIVELARADSSSISVSSGTINFSLSPGSSQTLDRLGIVEFNNNTITSQVDITVEAVPEPSAYLGVITSMAIIFGLRRKSSRTSC